MTSPGQNKAMTALLLLMPQTPMLFQGQEWAASSTFHFFADHHPELAKLVCAGREKELSQFPSVRTTSMIGRLLNPADKSVFERSKLKWDDLGRSMHAQMLEFHRDLLKLRREEPTFRRVQKRGDIDGAVLSAEAFVLRYFGEGGDDRLVLVNLGRDLNLAPAPEPLLAPPAGMRWSILWTSEDPKYGGCGTPPPDTEKEGWALAGRCTTVLKPLPAKEAAVATRVLMEIEAKNEEVT
jgi:maltooligosyltrehalose trehalohydrolase